MRITTWAEYGVICALHLAKRDEEVPVTGRELSAREGLPADYVEQILLRLRRAGIVYSCSIRPVWLMLQQRIDEVLEGVRLSDLLDAEPRVRRRVGLPVLTA